MPKGKEEKVEETSAEPIVEPKPETQAKTFTQKELDAIGEKVRQEELEKYQGIQRAVSKKDSYIHQLEDKLSRQPSSPSKTVLDILEEQFAGDPRVSQLKAEVTKQEQITRQDTLSQEVRRNLEAKIEATNQDPSDEKFEGVWDSFDLAYAIDGKFERAERKLDRILPKATKSEGAEVEGEKLEKLIEEGVRKKLEEKGLLGSETGGPSASSSHYEDLRDRYNVDPSSLSQSEQTEYLRLRAERGVFNP